MKNKAMTSNNQKAKELNRQQMKIVIVGHVDHGKSTLVGRLFHDTDSLPDGKLEQVQASCKRRGMQFEWSFLMDALQAERDQEITIDTSQIWFKTKQRDYVIIDAPGHKEFLKNMISGAASSEAALLIIDANEGVKEQSKRHGYLLHLLGVQQITVAVNKMDLVGYSQERFDEIEKEYRAYLKGIGVEPQSLIPISARQGDNIANASENMDWYKGPTIIEALDEFSKKPSLNNMDLRFPIQDVYRFDEHKRIFAGRIESGSLKVGDNLLFSPSNKTSKIKTIEFWKKEPQLTEASAGMSIGVTLDEQIFVERGEVASLYKNPPKLTNLFRAKIFWLNQNNLTAGKWYTMKINTSEYKVEVREVEKVISTDDLSHKTVKTVTKNSVAEVVFKVRGLAAIDEFTLNQKTGRFMLLDSFDVAGGGILSMEGFTDQRVIDVVDNSNEEAQDSHKITTKQRSLSNGHAGGILWFVGVESAGKTTLAYELEKKLFAKGYQVCVLDEDQIYNGICSDLADKKDSSEVIRRTSQVAKLFANAGVIVITTLTSHDATDRKRARAALPTSFHSVYIQNSEVKNNDFDWPFNADLTINNKEQTTEDNIKKLANYVEEHLVEGGFDKVSNDTGYGI